MAWNKKEEEKHEMPIELMSYDQLLALKIRVDQELTGRGASELQALKEKVTMIADAHGVTVSDLFGIRAPRKVKEKRKQKPKYRDPETGDEWSGRGHPPAWMKEKLEAGAEKDDFLIDNVVHLNS